MTCKHGLDPAWCGFCAEFNKRLSESQRKNKKETEAFEKSSVNKQANSEVTWYD